MSIYPYTRIYILFCLFISYYTIPLQTRSGQKLNHKNQQNKFGLLVTENISKRFEFEVHTKTTAEARTAKACQRTFLSRGWMCRGVGVSLIGDWEGRLPREASLYVYIYLHTNIIIYYVPHCCSITRVHYNTVGSRGMQMTAALTFYIWFFCSIYI